MKKKRLYPALIIFVLAVAGMGYQNCSGVNFSQIPNDEGSMGVPNDGGPGGGGSSNPNTGPLVCDPFSPTGTADCSGGIGGKIYYLSESLRDQYGTEGTDTYIEYGIELNVTVLLKNLAIPTRSFLSGFPTSDGKVLTDENGQVLNEYFGMDLRTILKLNSDSSKGAVQSEGYYQFAILSDDGARVDILSDQGSYIENLVFNDNNHPTTMGCSSSAIYLRRDKNIPLGIRYYQGPREHIALKMLWRKVDTPAAPLDDLCGASGNQTFYGPDYDDYSNQYGYGQLIQRGWRVPSPENFLSIGN